jgi:hypothetical protein
MTALPALLLLPGLAAAGLCPVTRPPAGHLAPACISSTLLQLDPSRRLRVGGRGGPATCLAACNAVYRTERGEAVAVHRAEGGEGVVCGCLGQAPEEQRIGPQVLATLLLFLPGVLQPDLRRG